MDSICHKKKKNAQEELSEYKIDLQQADRCFNDFAALALTIANIPSVVIAFCTRGTPSIKATAGCVLHEHNPEHFICNLLIEKGRYLEVEDTLKHDSFKFTMVSLTQPVVRFLGKMPIVSKNGIVIGSICLMDRHPRKLTADQISTLYILSRIITNHLELFRA